MANIQVSWLRPQNRLYSSLLLLTCFIVVIVMQNTAFAEKNTNISGHAIIKSLTGIKAPPKKNSKNETYAFDTPIKFIGSSTKKVKNKKDLDEIGRAMVSEDMSKVNILIRFPVDKKSKIAKKLTKKRAHYIQNYLIKKYGISRSRLKTQVR